MKLTLKEEALHERALSLVRKHKEVEAEIVQVLQEMEHSKIYKKFNQPSLFMYATSTLGLSAPIAYAFIAVARKARVVHQLQAAINSHQLSVAQASRLVSHLKPENADDIIEYSRTHTYRETEAELARRNPMAKVPDKVKFLSEDQVQLTITISKSGLKNLERSVALEAQRGKMLTKSEAIETALAYYVDRKDPVKKAERVKYRRKSSTELCAHRVDRAKNRREPLSAIVRHLVFTRDQGRCTHVDASGVRCNQDRWIDFHHIIPVSRGGGNEPDNLTSLCTFHHDLVHQLSFPIDGQVSWLRSRGRAYGADEPSPILRNIF